LFSATVWGSRPALLAALLGVTCFNYFFLPPVYTFTIADPQNWVALAAFLITALVARELSARAKRRAEEAEAGRREIERLYNEYSVVAQSTLRSRAGEESIEINNSWTAHGTFYAEQGRWSCIAETRLTFKEYVLPVYLIQRQNKALRRRALPSVTGPAITSNRMAMANLRSLYVREPHNLDSFRYGTSQSQLLPMKALDALQKIRRLLAPRLRILYKPLTPSL